MSALTVLSLSMFNSKFDIHRTTFGTLSSVVEHSLAERWLKVKPRYLTVRERYRQRSLQLDGCVSLKCCERPVFESPGVRSLAFAFRLDNRTVAAISPRP